MRIIEKVKHKYHRHTIQYLIVNGPFVRGRGLHEGMSAIEGSPIVFFCDVDMVFTTSTRVLRMANPDTVRDF